MLGQLNKIDTVIPRRIFNKINQNFGKNAKNAKDLFENIDVDSNDDFCKGTRQHFNISWFREETGFWRVKNMRWLPD